MGQSQAVTAKAIGVTFQQLQKYEKSVNRVSAGRLLRLAAALHVQPEYFFTARPSDAVEECVGSADGQRLIKAFVRIDSPTVRTSFIALMEAAAQRCVKTKVDG